MRKLFISFVMLLMLSVPSLCFSAVGIKVDGVPQGAATDLNFTGTGTNLTNDGSSWTFNLALSGVANGGSVSMASNETAVSVSYALVRKVIAENPAYSAGTLANGKPGQLLSIIITAVEGAGTFVLTPTTKQGFTSLTFNGANDFVTLLYVNDTVGWIIISVNSITIA